MVGTTGPRLDETVLDPVSDTVGVIVEACSCLAEEAKTVVAGRQVLRG